MRSIPRNQRFVSSALYTRKPRNDTSSNPYTGLEKYHCPVLDCTFTGKTLAEAKSKAVAHRKKAEKRGFGFSGIKAEEKANAKKSLDRQAEIRRRLNEGMA